MAFTAHGHQIPGTIAEERPPGMSVARCGGVNLCNQCKTEAAFHTTPQTEVEWNIDANRPKVESQSFEEQTPLPAGPVRFRKNPIEFEAIQWTGDNLAEMQRFTGIFQHDERGEVPVFQTEVSPDLTVGYLWVAANHAFLEIEVGEWVVRDELGFYPCKDAVIRTNNTELNDEMIAFLRERAEPKTFEQELVSLLNKHSMENYSGTPDWILGEYIRMSLQAWDLGVRLRSEWRGEDLELPAIQRLQKDDEVISRLKALVADGIIHLNPEFRNTQLYSDLKESAPNQDVVARLYDKEVPLVIYTNGQRNEVGTAKVTVTPGEVLASGTITGAIPQFEEEKKDVSSDVGVFSRYQKRGLSDG